MCFLEALLQVKTSKLKVALTCLYEHNKPSSETSHLGKRLHELMITRPKEKKFLLSLSCD